MASVGVVHLELGDFGEATLWKSESDGSYTFTADLSDEYDNKEMKKIAAFLRKCADKMDADLKRWAKHK